MTADARVVHDTREARAGAMEGDVGAGPAHVERDDLRETRFACGVFGTDHAASGSGEQHAHRLTRRTRGVERAARALHDRELGAGASARQMIEIGGEHRHERR